MEHHTLIAKLGGPHALRDKLEQRGVKLTPVAVRAWALGRKRGRTIPAKYWMHVVAIAQSVDLPVTIDDLAQGVAAEPKRPTKVAA